MHCSMRCARNLRPAGGAGVHQGIRCRAAMTTTAGSRGRRQERIAAYKTTLRRFIDQRPSGIRRKIAEVTGTHKSFISQITNPSDATPLPARHIDSIFAVCHLSPEEQQEFLKEYHSAHPGQPEHRNAPPAPYPHTAPPGSDDGGRKEAEGARIADPGHGAATVRSGGVSVGDRSGRGDRTGRRDSPCPCRTSAG